MYTWYTVLTKCVVVPGSPLEVFGRGVTQQGIITLMTFCPRHTRTAVMYELVSVTAQTFWLGQLARPMKSQSENEIPPGWPWPYQNPYHANDKFHKLLHGMINLPWRRSMAMPWAHTMSMHEPIRCQHPAVFHGMPWNTVRWNPMVLPYWYGYRGWCLLVARPEALQ